MSQYIHSADQEDDMPGWAKRLEQNIINQFQSQFDQLRAQLTANKEEVEVISERITDLEFHTRKYNLLFFGLKVTADDCERQVKTFLKNELEIESADDMIMAACHPLPSPQGQACIARFVRLPDKDLVLRSLPKLRGKNNKVSVSTDLPKEAREKRKVLSKQAATLRRNGEMVRVRERGCSVWLEEKKNGVWKKRE
jgi:hypothetical protein